MDLPYLWYNHLGHQITWSKNGNTKIRNLWHVNKSCWSIGFPIDWRSVPRFHYALEIVLLNISPNPAKPIKQTWLRLNRCRALKNLSLENKNTNTFIAYKIYHSTFGIQVGKHIAVAYTASKWQPSFLHKQLCKRHSYPGGTSGTLLDIIKQINRFNLFDAINCSWEYCCNMSFSCSTMSPVSKNSTVIEFSLMYLSGHWKIGTDSPTLSGIEED